MQLERKEALELWQELARPQARNYSPLPVFKITYTGK